MPDIIELGSNSLFGMGGLQLGPRIARGNFRTVVLPSGILVGPVNPYTRVKVSGSALANNGTAVLAANANPSYNIVTMLSLRSSIAGDVQLLVGTDIVLQIELAVNTTKFIPLPTDGLLISDPTSDFKLKNITGFAIDYLVNIAWSTIEPLG